MTRRPVDRMILSLAWGNPCTDPPPGIPTFGDRHRTRWSVTLLDRTAETEIRGHMPANVLGDGWCHCLTFQPAAPPARWSAEAKGRVRRKRLRERLDRRFPLLAEQLYAAAIAERPSYYRGEGR
ncbi:MAG: hypothetical protein RIB84_13650 [Sneathiellaceae bacterium]